MAIIQVQQQQLGGPSFTVSSAAGQGDGLYVLGDAEDGFVGTVVIQIVERSAGTCSFTVKGRSRQAGSSIADGSSAGEAPFKALPYLLLNLGTTVQSGNTYATAAIADQDALLMVQATGLVIGLEVDWTSGIFDVYVTKVAGASC